MDFYTVPRFLFRGAVVGAVVGLTLHLIGDTPMLGLFAVSLAAIRLTWILLGAMGTERR